MSHRDDQGEGFKARARTPQPDREATVMAGQSRPKRDPMAEAAEALTNMSLALAEVLNARERLAAALAKIAHPTPPLKAIEDVGDEH